MTRLVVYLLAVALAASGLAWLADRPGTLQIAWQGYVIETTVLRATVMLGLLIAGVTFIWSILRAIWKSPSLIGERIVTKRNRRGLDSISSGLIAIGAGDSALASRYAAAARKALPHEPLTHLLRAQAAELAGDRPTARRIYESMLASPDTEQLGLRGLFLEAEREGEGEAARHYADRALKSNPKLEWSSDALFQSQCRQRDWAGALNTLSHARKSGHAGKAVADRRRAVLLTAQAVELEDDDPDLALTLAMDAHALATDLSPAAAVAGRIYASRGATAKAAKVLQRTWAKSPHPDLAAAYSYARIGDSPTDRLDRIRQLAALNPHSIESPVAIATTAIEARAFSEARAALEPVISAGRLTRRVAMLMARIEAGEKGEKGRVREWLARAANAAADPVWMADGVIADRWEPISPVTGGLDAFQWRAPLEARDEARAKIIDSRLEDLLAISAAGPVSDDAAAASDERVRHAVGLSNGEGDEPVTSNTAQPPRSSTHAATASRSDNAATYKNPLSRANAERPTAAPAAQVTDVEPTAPRAPDDPGPVSDSDEIIAALTSRNRHTVN